MTLDDLGPVTILPSEVWSTDRQLNSETVHQPHQGKILVFNSESSF